MKARMMYLLVFLLVVASCASLASGATAMPTISGVTVPSSLTLGSAFTISGTVHANGGTLDRLSVSISTPAGSHHSVVTQNLSGSSYSLSSLGNIKKASEAITTAGSYRVRLWVANKGQENGTLLIDKYFTVTEPKATTATKTEVPNPKMSNFAVSSSPYVREALKLSGTVSANGGTLRKISISLSTPLGDHYTVCDKDLSGSSLNLSSLGALPSTSSIISTAGQYRIRIWVANVGQSNGEQLVEHYFTVSAAPKQPSADNDIGSQSSTQHPTTTQNYQPIQVPKPTITSKSVPSTLKIGDALKLGGYISANGGTLNVLQVSLSTPRGTNHVVTRESLSGSAYDLSSLGALPNIANIITTEGEYRLRLWVANVGQDSGDLMIDQTIAVSKRTIPAAATPMQSSLPGSFAFKDPTPKSDAVVDKKDTTIEWTKSGNASYYRVTVLDSASRKIVSSNAKWENTTYVIKASVLEEGHKYIVNVEAYNAAGSRAITGTARSFSIKKAATSSSSTTGTQTVNQPTANTYATSRLVKAKELSSFAANLDTYYTNLHFVLETLERMSNKGLTGLWNANYLLSNLDFSMVFGKNISAKSIIKNYLYEEYCLLSESKLDKYMSSAAATGNSLNDIFTLAKFFDSITETQLTNLVKEIKNFARANSTVLNTVKFDQEIRAIFSKYVTNIDRVPSSGLWAFAEEAYGGKMDLNRAKMYKVAIVNDKSKWHGALEKYAKVVEIGTTFFEYAQIVNAYSSFADDAVSRLTRLKASVVDEVTKKAIDEVIKETQDSILGLPEKMAWELMFKSMGIGFGAGVNYAAKKLSSQLIGGAAELFVGTQIVTNALTNVGSQAEANYFLNSLMLMNVELKNNVAYKYKAFASVPNDFTLTELSFAIDALLRSSTKCIELEAKFMTDRFLFITNGKSISSHKAAELKKLDPMRAFLAAYPVK